MDSRQGLSRQKLRSAPVAPGDPALYRGSVVGSSHPGESQGVVQSRGLYGGRPALVSSHGSGPRRGRCTAEHVGKFGVRLVNSLFSDQDSLKENREFTSLTPNFPRNNFPPNQSKSLHLYKNSRLWRSTRCSLQRC